MSLNILGKQENIAYYFVEDLNLDVSLLDERDAKYDGPCSVEGTLVLKNRKVFINAVCRQIVSFLCDRCLDPAKKEFVFDFECTYQEKEGEYLYSNSIVDLTEKVQEEFVVSLPIQMLCKEECKGLCSSCGENLNHKQCDCEKKIDIDENNPFSILMNKDFN